ncbi:MAG: hypothetical protein QOC82_3376 [Frankiaceae bacterium]|jgi:hypothetical protein|nr:hypothetical protein [Frankiaceae bacterium]
MIIDCDRCEMRNIACDDCVVNVLLAMPSAADPGEGDLSVGEETAIALRNLADGGLVPPLRLSLRDAAFG